MTDVSPGKRASEVLTIDQVRSVDAAVSVILPVRLTPAGLDGLLTGSLLGEALTGGIYDTDVREELADVIARAAVGSDWPSYGEGLTDEQISAFSDRVVARLVDLDLAVRR